MTKAMPQWIGILLLVATGGLLIMFVSYRPTQDTYVIISEAVTTTPHPSSSSTTAKPSLHKKLLNVDSDVGTTEVSLHSVAPVKVTHPPPHHTWQNVLTRAVKTPVLKEENIFFIESSCAVSGAKKFVHMTGRQGCAIESAALTNPNASVYYLDTCGSTRELSEDHPVHNKVIREVLKYPNVKIYHVGLDNYFRNTPLHEWISEGHLEDSKYPVEHSSDILRLVTLWKFGGVYLDLDFVVLRSLTDLKHNYVVLESDELFANSVLSFSADGSGHEVATKCLEDLLANYNGEEWGYNGPYLITRVMERVCNGASVLSMTPERCKGVTVHRPPSFFPFYYPAWEVLFDEGTSDSTMALLLKDGTYGVHAWNKMSHEGVIRVGSKQPYALLASRFCPKVYSVVGETF